MTSLVEIDGELPAGLLIGDAWVHDTTAGVLAHVNPATGTVQQEFAVAGPTEVNAAVTAAMAAFTDWRKWSAAEREAVLRNLARLLREHGADFGIIGARESGIPLTTANYLAPVTADWIDYYAGWIDKNTGQTIPAVGAFDYTRPEPIGVAAVLLTWNSSSAAFGASVGAALAAGCSVVVKPAELAPFSGSLFGRLCLEAGLPAGVVNIVPGGRQAGEALVRHPGIAKISFTGGVETAKAIQATAAESLTPLLLELGGKSANIVFADADIDVASSVVVGGLAALNGQTCIAPTRLLVQESSYAAMLDAVKDKVGQLKLGSPFDADTAMGPIISEGAVNRIVDFVDRAKSDRSGTLVTGGDRLTEGMGGGFFVSPAVFADVDNNSNLARQEIFGPVLSAFLFRTEAEAIELANSTSFGLSAYVQTRDLERAHHVAHELDAGTVWVNAPGAPFPGAPFGGFKSSGYGKQGGKAGLDEFTRIKNVNITLRSESL